MIDKFSGKYSWLSNFFLCNVIYEGRVYPSIENAYQAAKYLATEREYFTTCSPSKAKKHGKFVELPNMWENRKLLVMEKLLNQKFQIGTYLHDKLLETGDVEIVEGNVWGDVFWGVCNDIGENHLGKMIMEIREKLK